MVSVTFSAAFLAYSAEVLSSLMLSLGGRGCGDFAQDRGEHRDRCGIFDPLGKSVRGS